jgi:DHA1 family tetracycline resistance protein-like MFS transporter
MKKSPLVSILAIVFIDLIGFGMIIPILPLYAQRFQATEWQIGLLLASYSFMQFLASPILGWFSDRYGRKPVLLCSLIGSATGYILMADATSLTMLFLARILAGVAGASVGTASAYIADITPPENRSKRIGLIGAAFGIGFVLGPAIGGLLSQWSVVAPFWFAAVLSILNAVLMWMVLPEPDRHAARQRGPANLKQTFEQAGSWRLGTITLTYFIGIAGFAIVTVIYPQVSHRRFELNQSQISFIFVLVGLIGAAIQGGGIGRLVKRFGDVNLAIAGFVIMAISMMMMPLAGSVPLSECHSLQGCLRRPARTGVGCSSIIRQFRTRLWPGLGRIFTGRRSYAAHCSIWKYALSGGRRYHADRLWPGDNFASTRTGECDSSFPGRS